MKKIVLMLALAATALTAVNQSAHAQVSVSCNIGSQPMWGPTGYDYAGNYYLPDIDAYYSVDDGQFIYQDGGDWVYGATLPYRYRNYDLYNGYKVVVNGPRPWLRNDYYRRQYWSYRGRRNQPFIRDSRDYRYFQNERHPYHSQWNGPRGYYGGGRGYRGNGYAGGYNGVDREGRGSRYMGDRGGNGRDRFDQRGDDRRQGGWDRNGGGRDRAGDDRGRGHDWNGGGRR